MTKRTKMYVDYIFENIAFTNYDEELGYFFPAPKGWKSEEMVIKSRLVSDYYSDQNTGGIWVKFKNKLIPKKFKFYHPPLP